MNLDVHARTSSNYRKHTAGNPIQRALIDRFHQRIVREVVALAPDSFLDAGCGEGFVARRMLEAMPNLELTGCDLSAGALEIARETNPSARFVPGSVVELPFPDNAFDVVGCFEVLEHLPGDLPELALAEFARVARRGVVLSVPHEPAFSLANAARGKNLDIRPRGSDPDHKQFWSRAAFGALVAKQMRVRRLIGSFPWTICVADTSMQQRGRVGANGQGPRPTP
ncbi:MAG: class I SAM-dependent methyltransferase [Thermomicrobiales bacterium]|nr:class I SAM-dependent methyltransferase [Thermomicrobiales bacterium]